MIGAVEIARVLPDPAMREKVLASSRDFLLRSFGPPQSCGPRNVAGTWCRFQEPEGTGKPDRSTSAPRHRVGVVGGDSTPCMFGLGKNNANSADRAGSVWILSQPEAIQKRGLEENKGSPRSRLLDHFGPTSGQKACRGTAVRPLKDRRAHRRLRVFCEHWRKRPGNNVSELRISLPITSKTHSEQHDTSRRNTPRMPDICQT
jgi:hypothetical protein